VAERLLPAKRLSMRLSDLDDHKKNQKNAQFRLTGTVSGAIYIVWPKKDWVGHEEGFFENEKVLNKSSLGCIY
jgi:hypothetical protein